MPAAGISAVGDMLAGAGQDGTAGGLPGLYVLTNKKTVHGFSVVFYPGVLKTIAGELGQGFHVLPFSAHEAVIVPDSMGIPPQGLKEAVVRVGREDVAWAGALSENIYYYDREKDGLRMEGGGIWGLKG